jgi:hypothetical protein
MTTIVRNRKRAARETNVEVTAGVGRGSMRPIKTATTDYNQSVTYHQSVTPDIIPAYGRLDYEQGYPAPKRLHVPVIATSMHRHES